MTKKVAYHPTCDVAYAMTLLGGKWKVPILWKLMTNRVRFSDLRRQLEGVSEGVLIIQLKELERDMLVRRIVYDKVPPHVEYELTEKGMKLKPALIALSEWGEQIRF